MFILKKNAFILKNDTVWTFASKLKETHLFLLLLLGTTKSPGNYIKMLSK